MKLGKILIRADAGVEMGTGHVMRCLGLAQAWQDAGGEAAFAMASSTSAIEKRLSAEGLQVLAVPARAGTNEDANATAKLALDHAAEWIVADGYRFGSEYQERVRTSGRRLLCIDDFGGSESYSADLVLNQNLNPVEDWYRKREASTGLLLGPRYALLRREFRAWQGWKREPSAGGSKVLITMGGSDPENVTLIAAQALRAAEVEGLEAAIVVGGSNPHFESIAEAVKDFPRKVRIERNAVNMAELMAWADIAVSAAGSTCWEMCMLGLPAIVVDVAANQVRLACELERGGCSVHVAQGDATVEVIRGKIEWLMQSDQLRADMSRRGAELVDGNGAARVVAAMRARAITLRSAGTGDCRKLWEWANEATVRQASFNSSPIAWEQHCEWFAKQLDDERSRVLIFEDGRSTPVGSVRFHATSDSDAEMSVTIAPEFRGQGMAPCLIDQAAQFTFEQDTNERIHAFIRTENRVSAKSFENAGFFLVGSTQIKGCDALHYIRERGATGNGDRDGREQTMEMARCR